MLRDLPNAFPYRLAHQRGLSDRRLRDLVAAGELERLGHGVYRKTDAPPADLDRIELAIRVPDATLCLTTALSIHDLTDAIPTVLDVALPRTMRPPQVQGPVRWHRFNAETFSVGRETIEVDDGLVLGLYSAERCVLDTMRLRHQEGEDVAIEALRRWLGRPRTSPATLLDMARRFPKVESFLLQTLRVLL